MKKLFYIILISLVIGACSQPVEQAPFKSGDIVYLKIDTTRAIIKYDGGKFDDVNYIYRIVYKTKSGEIKGKFVLSSEIFSKK